MSERPDRYPEPTRLQKTLMDAVNSAGLSNKELAYRSNLHVSSVSELLQGRVRGTLTSWQALLDATDIEVGWRVRHKDDY